MKYLTPGIITGVLGFLATVAGIFHYDALGAFFSDPNTSANIQVAIGLGMSLISAFMAGIKKTP